MKSKKNLALAFSGEILGNKTLLSFAERADEEGFPQVAKIFRAAAVGESIHSHNFLRAMGGGKIVKGNINVSNPDGSVKSTRKNLKVAIRGEKMAHGNVYPSFIEIGKLEENHEAEKAFQWASEVEKIHEQLFEEALNCVKNGMDIDEKEIYLCPVCGYISERSIPTKCPVCGVPNKKFVEIL